MDPERKKLLITKGDRLLETKPLFRNSFISVTNAFLVVRNLLCNKRVITSAIRQMQVYICKTSEVVL